MTGCITGMTCFRLTTAGMSVRVFSIPARGRYAKSRTCPSSISTRQRDTDIAVKLTWIAGEGNTTVIRAGEDGFPTGYGDGRLVVEMPSTYGQRLYYYDTAAPQGAILYYKAFSLTMDTSGEVLDDSFVECAATDTTFTHGFIATEESSWGAIKKIKK